MVRNDGDLSTIEDVDSVRRPPVAAADAYLFLVLDAKNPRRGGERYSLRGMSEANFLRGAAPQSDVRGGVPTSCSTIRTCRRSTRASRDAACRGSSKTAAPRTARSSTTTASPRRRPWSTAPSCVWATRSSNFAPR